jgi:hypothetical protein
VTAQDEPAFEAEQQVLADGLDTHEPLAVQALGQPLDRRTRMGSLNGDPLADEHLKISGGAVKCVSLGHSAPR